MRRASRRIKRFTGEVGAASKRVAGMTAKLGALGAAGLAAATIRGAKFEQSMSRVKAITNATADEFTRLEKSARSLGRTTQFTASQVAEAQGFFALAGFKTNQILQALEPTLKAAVAGNLDIAQSADIAVGIMGGMGIQAKDLGGAMEVLARGFTSSNTTIQELGQAFKFVGPVGKSAGKSLEELTAVLQIFADAGIRGSMAGTALRNILLRLQIQPAEVAGPLKKLRIEIKNQEGGMRSLADIIDDLNAKTANLGQVEKNALIGRIAGLRAVAAFSKLMDAGGDAIRRNEAALRSNGDTLGRIASVQMDTLRGAFLRLVSAAEGLAIGISKVTIKFIRPIVEKLAKAFNVLEKFFERNLDVIIVLVQQVAELGREMLDFVGITGAAAGALDFFGATGSSAMERLTNGLTVVEVAMRRLDLVADIVVAAWDLALATIADSAKFTFTDRIPAALKNLLFFFLDVSNGIRDTWIKLVTDLASLFDKIPDLIKAKDPFAEIEKLITDVFKDAGTEFIDKALARVTDIPKRQESAIEKALSDSLAGLIAKFDKEVADTIDKTARDRKFKVTITPEIEPPKLGAGGAADFLKPILSPLAALERGTAAAFRAERGVLENRLKESIKEGFVDGSDFARDSIGQSIERAFNRGLEDFEQAFKTTEAELKMTPIPTEIGQANVPGVKKAVNTNEKIEMNTADIAEQTRISRERLEDISRNTRQPEVVFAFA